MGSNGCWGIRLVMGAVVGLWAQQRDYFVVVGIRGQGLGYALSLIAPGELDKRNCKNECSMGMDLFHRTPGKKNMVYVVRRHWSLRRKSESEYRHGA